MPEVKEEGDEDVAAMAQDAVTKGTRLVCFDLSPIMSTYLLAFVVGEFEACESKTKNNITVRCLTPRGKKEQGSFAMNTSVRALEYYDKFFDVPYPLPKYECIAIADFACGAMENWGLVTYRESCVLVDPQKTSSAIKQWVAIVVNHEMAHQWFGNLVTMEWWTHIWLNEGFASFMENECTNTLFPEFDIWTQFVSNALIAALELDSLENSHPIEVEVGHPSEVDEIFDKISYFKGASVIRMLHDFIGHETFRRGLHKYLIEHKYKNTLTEDLWRSLSEASQKPVQHVMSTWTNQMGFPVVMVDRTKHENGTMNMRLTQTKFTADGQPPKVKFHWQIPINIVTSEGNTVSILMEDETMNITIECGSWIKLNHDFIGYYRVQYEPDYLNAFLPDISSHKMSELNRLSLLDDLMAAVQCGRISTNVVLKFISTGFRLEESYVVWICINNCFSKLLMLLSDDDEATKMLKVFILDIMSHIIESVGWKAKKGEHHTRGLLRMVIISRMGQLGHAKTVAEAKMRFAEHVSGTNKLEADLRAPVYTTVMANGDRETFDKMVSLYCSEDLHEEKDRIARSMGSATNFDILHSVLQFAISDHVRSQDSPSAIAAVASNPKGRDAAWVFYKSKSALFMERYMSGMMHSRLVKSVTENFASADRANAVETFFTMSFNPAERTVQQSVENVMLNEAWLKRDGENMKKFLV